jgi:putative DNA primase/helicase
VELEHLLEKFDLAEETKDGYLALCPAHNDTNPSLVISRKANGTILIRCRAGCDTENILRKVDLTFADLFEVKGKGPVVESNDMPLSPGDRAALALYLNRSRQRVTPEVLAYARRRFGIDEKKFDELELGFDSGDITGGKLRLSPGTYHDVPRLVVPFNDFAGNPHYLQARYINGKSEAKWSGPINPPGSTWGKYGYFEGGTGWDEVIIAEGPGDALTAAAVGYDSLAIRGAGLASNRALLEELAAGLNSRRIIIAGDSDEAGMKFANVLADELTRRGLNVCKLTIPAKDLSEWQEREQDFPKLLRKAVSNATPVEQADVFDAYIDEEINSLFNDVENARALQTMIRNDGSDIRFTPELGWIVYRPAEGVWIEDKPEWIRQMAQRVFPAVQDRARIRMNELENRVLQEMSDGRARGDLITKIESARESIKNRKLVQYTMSRRGIDSMMRELEALEGVYASITEFDLHPKMLAVKNGVVDLETGELQPFSEATKGMYLTRKIDVNYDPAATNPRWEQFLREIFPDNPELPGYIQRLTGYGITGFTTEQCFAVLWGNGANGKSVLTEVLATIFGPISVTTSFATFEAKRGGGIPNDVAALKGARLVMASEGNRNSPMDEATIKKLTGDGIVQARFMRQEFFEFQPTFLIMLATNYKPDFRGQDDGLWRRVKLIPFKRFFESEDRDGYLAAKFTGKEVPRFAWRNDEDFGDGPAGILTWAISGARTYFQEGLNDPDVVKVATSDYRVGSDALNGFVGDVIVPDPKGKISGKEVWELYLTWCEDEGMPFKDRWRKQTLWKALEERGATRTVHARTIGFRGYRRLTPEDGASTLEESEPFEPK